jgi:MFS family permease
MKKKLLMLTILLGSFASMADLVVTPAAANIFASFSYISPVMQNLFLTGPMLLSCIGALACGGLAKRFDKKSILIVSYVFFIVASVGGGLVHSIVYMVVMRLIVGFTYGVIMTASLGLIAEVFVEEKDRSFMLGAYSAVGCVIAMIMSAASGYIALGDWQNCFYIYLFAVPVLVMTIVYVPKTAPEGESEEGTGDKKSIPWGKLLPILVAYLLVNLTYCGLTYYLSLYLEETGIGDASTAGICTSLVTCGSMIIGFVFSRIYVRTKRATPAIAFMISAVVFLTLSVTKSVAVLMVMCVLTGVSYMLSVAYYQTHVSYVVPPSVVSMAMGILTATLSVGGFLSPYFMYLYQYLFKVTTYAETYWYIGLTLLAAAVISTVLTVRSRDAAEAVAE